MSAMPMGMPGWPELAFWTASMLNARMALASCRRVGIEDPRRKPDYFSGRGEAWVTLFTGACHGLAAPVISTAQNVTDCAASRSYTPR